MRNRPILQLQPFLPSSRSRTFAGLLLQPFERSLLVRVGIQYLHKVIFWAVWLFRPIGSDRTRVVPSRRIHSSFFLFSSFNYLCRMLAALWCFGRLRHKFNELEMVYPSQIFILVAYLFILQHCTDCSIILVDYMWEINNTPLVVRA